MSDREKKPTTPGEAFARVGALIGGAMKGEVGAVLGGTIGGFAGLSIENLVDWVRAPDRAPLRLNPAVEEKLRWFKRRIIQLGEVARLAQQAMRRGFWQGGRPAPNEEGEGDFMIAHKDATKLRRALLDLQALDKEKA